MQKVYLCVFVPQTAGPAGHHRAVDQGVGLGHFERAVGARHRPHGDDKALVRLGLRGSEEPGGRGRVVPHRRHALRLLHLAAPARRRPGARTMDRRLLGGMLFAVVLLGGLALLRSGLAPRLLAVGGLVVVLVLAGVFLPTFSLQVLNGTLLAAVVVVLVLWAVV